MATARATAAPSPPPPPSPSPSPPPAIRYVQYDPARESEYVPAMRELVARGLSEPYSLYVYRYFLHEWGDLCRLALNDRDEIIGVVVCKLERHRGGPLRGYIAMLSVRDEYRGRGIATELVCMAIRKMADRDADEIVLETETTNQAAMRLYSRLGFLRSKKLHRYYLNGNSAYRLVLYLKEGTSAIATYTATGCAQGQEGQEGRLAYEQQAEHGMHGGGTVV